MGWFGLVNGWGWLVHFATPTCRLWELLGAPSKIAVAPSNFLEFPKYPLMFPRKNLFPQLMLQLWKNLLPCHLMEELLPQEATEEGSSVVANYNYGRTFFFTVVTLTTVFRVISP